MILSAGTEWRKTAYNADSLSFWLVAFYFIKLCCPVYFIRAFV